MTDEELIETLRAFEKERVENLNESTRNVFNAIMKIADERDDLQRKYEELLKVNHNLIEKIKKAIKKLSSAVNHFHTQRENNVITFTLKILKGGNKE